MSSDDLLEAAWGIIANTGGGDWSKESTEWRRAAERWRGGYHAHISADAIPLSQFVEEAQAVAPTEEKP